MGFKVKWRLNIFKTKKPYWDLALSLKYNLDFTVNFNVNNNGE
jgi:hypothetical protein